MLTRTVIECGTNDATLLQMKFGISLFILNAVYVRHFSI